MEGDDDLDSLFAGMEFVTPFSLDSDSPPPTIDSSHSRPLDPLDFLESSIASKDHHDISTPNRHPDHPVNGHILAADAGSQFRYDDADSVGSSVIHQTPKDSESQKSIQSIMAAYDTVLSKPSSAGSSSVSKLSVDASKPAVRRKKRSLKIGYGRGSDDFEEGKSSTVEQAMINGDAVDESEPIIATSNNSYEGLILTGIKADLGVVEGSNGDTDFSDAGKVEFVEQSGNSNADPNALRSSPGVKERFLERDQETEKVEGNGIEHPAGEEPAKEILEFSKPVHIDDEAEERTSEVSTRSESESAEPASACEVNKAPIVDSRDGAEEACTNHVIPEAPTSGLEENALRENENEMPELCIQVPPGYSIEERLEFIKKAVARKLKQIQQRVAIVSQERKAAAQKRRQAAEEVSSTSSKFKEIEAELEAACEREDFDRAESLSETLGVAEQAMEAALGTFRATEADYDLCAWKVQEVMQLQVAIEEEGAKLMEELGQEAEVMGERVKKEAEERTRSEMDTLTAEEEAVKLKKKKFSFELRVVEEEKSKLSNVIEESIQVELEEKRLLAEKRQVLAEELENLLAAVRAKEADIAQHDNSIKDIEEKINGTLARFEKERLGLETDFESLSSALESLEKDFDYLITKKVEIEANVVQAQEEKKKLEDFSRLAEKEAQMLQDALQIRKSVALNALCSKEKRESLALEEKQAVELAQSLRNQAASLRTSLQELASERMKLQQESLSANHRIDLIEKRGPEIEAEKKLAAAARNFKEAGRLATEAKVLSADKQRVTSDLNRITLELQKLEQELEVRISDLAVVDSQLLEKEKEAAMSRCERLRLLAAATRDERDAAAELEDFEEAESLHIEAEAADTEADELQRMHGFEGNVFKRSISIVSKITSDFAGRRELSAESPSIDEEVEDIKGGSMIEAEVDRYTVGQ